MNKFVLTVREKQHSIPQREKKANKKEKKIRSNSTIHQMFIDSFGGKEWKKERKKGKEKKQK